MYLDICVGKLYLKNYLYNDSTKCSELMITVEMILNTNS